VSTTEVGIDRMTGTTKLGFNVNGAHIKYASCNGKSW